MNKLGDLSVKKIGDLLLVLLGCFFFAIAYRGFLLPNHIVTGGVAGISMIMHTMFNWSPSIVMYAVNLPLILVAYVYLNREIFINTVASSFALPFFIEALKTLPILTDDLLLAAIFGGILAGLGTGIVFKNNGTTGGTSIIFELLFKYFHIPLNTSTLVIDAIIIFSSLIVFDTNAILYALISIYVTTYLIGIVQTGTKSEHNLFIFSEQAELLAEKIETELGISITQIPIKRPNQGMMLMCLVNKHHYHALEKLLDCYDKGAMVIVTSASDVRGNIPKVTQTVKK